MSADFAMLEEPLWPGGPPICSFSNLPAFETESELKAFMDQHFGSALAKWRCIYCQCWHYWAKPHPPSGSSNGDERGYRIPPEMLELIQHSKTDDTDRQ